MSKSKKHSIKNKIEQIRKMCEEELPRLIDSGISVNDYLAKGRINLNFLLIGTVFGCDFDTSKKNTKIKYGGKLPDEEELGEICAILNTFIYEYENGFINGDYEDDDDDDFASPMSFESQLVKLDKISTKKVNDYILGSKKSNSVARFILNSADVMVLAKMGKKLKKKQKTNKMLIIGGISIAVTAGVVTGICIAKHNKKKKEGEAEVEYTDLIGDGIDTDVTISDDAMGDMQVVNF